MHLETGSGSSTASPSAAEIDAALAALSGDDDFLILSYNEQTYLQAMGAPGPGFLVEYRDGSEDSHFQSVQSDVPLAVAQEIFRLYAEGDGAWRSRIEWKRWAAADGRPASLSRASVGVAVGVLAVLVLIAWMALAA
jgi:hypothetical protein